jgi:hypothetical protein
MTCNSILNYFYFSGAIAEIAPQTKHDVTTEVDRYTQWSIKQIQCDRKLKKNRDGHD